MNNSEKLNLKNDSNNNNNQQQNEVVDVNEKDDCEQNEQQHNEQQREREQGEGSPSMNNVSESLSPTNGNSDEISKFKIEESSKVANENANCFSHLLNSIMNFRRDETTFNLNNFISGANSSPIPNNVPANNLLMNDLNRNFFVPNFPPTTVDSGLEHLAMTSAQQFSKYGQGTCKFPGCNMIFDDLQNFTK
jgi:hypothetical protein